MFIRLLNIYESTICVGLAHKTEAPEAPCGGSAETVSIRCGGHLWGSTDYADYADFSVKCVSMSKNGRVGWGLGNAVGCGL